MKTTDVPAPLVPLTTGPTRLAGLDVDVVVRPERRGVRISIERDGRITVTVPPGVDTVALTRALLTRRRWITRKREERAADIAARPTREFVPGEGFLYLGRSYRFKLVDHAPAVVRLYQGRLCLRRDRIDSAADHLIGWYRRRGQAWLPDRAAPWAQRMHAPLDAITVRRLGYRWGSCSPHGGVNIHWAVMQLPIALADYVLVHELAHLHHHNHSPDFWRTVERALPDWRERRARLDAAGQELWLPED